MNDRILSLLGLCRRAGKVTVGNDAVREAVAKGKSKLVIAADDISENTKKEVSRVCALNNTDFLKISRSKESLSNALGRFCAVISVNDSGFANKLSELISEETEACL